MQELKHFPEKRAKIHIGSNIFIENLKKKYRTVTRTKEIKLFSYPHLPENAEVGFQNDQALGSVCAQSHSLWGDSWNHIVFE